jgi:alkanesulfonate monooxygenase SsuD/methylene tetrahydromethanopterin reductase-like flavin-dependent oxidoreductase (luciferase family)
MKKIGFLSFGHWSDHPAYKAQTASDTLLQSIDLAVAAEEIGLDGAYFRVHHFASQLASPFPLLSAIGAKYGGGCRRRRFDFGGTVAARR